MITLDNIRKLAIAGQVYADTPSFKEHRIRILTNDVVFQTTYGAKIMIMKGFEWDEASVPWYFRFAFPKSGKYAFAALLHDALYYQTTVTREVADREFYEWMKVTINTNQARLRYQFVKLFGWVYWNKNIKKPSVRCCQNRKLILEVG